MIGHTQKTDRNLGISDFLDDECFQKIILTALTLESKNDSDDVFETRGPFYILHFAKTQCIQAARSCSISTNG